jgi:hypothetical protein
MVSLYYITDLCPLPFFAYQSLKKFTMQRHGSKQNRRWSLGICIHAIVVKHKQFHSIDAAYFKENTGERRKFLLILFKRNHVSHVTISYNRRSFGSSKNINKRNCTVLYLETCILTCWTGEIPTESATPFGDTRIHS